MAMKVALIYYSRSGTTEEMAHVIARELKAKGVEVDMHAVEKFNSKSLTEYDGIIIGSPTYYGTCAAEVKKLFDESVVLHGKLDGKAGAAFASSANIGGGNETTVLSILEAMLIHGMIIQGDPQGDHYGPVAVSTLDARSEGNCKRLAERFVALLKKVR